MVKLRILHYLHKLTPGHHNHKQHDAKDALSHQVGEHTFPTTQRRTGCPADACVQRWARSDSICSHQNRARYVDLGPATTCSPNHQDDPASWMTNLNREGAEKALRGRPDGTFLVRRAAIGQYALSLVCNGITVHCMIYQEDGFYGFAAPYQYLAIEDLIRYYMSHSLENHNPNLRTRLVFPAFEK